MRKVLLITLLILVLNPVAHAQTAPTPSFIPESGTIGSCNFITGEMKFDCIPAYIAYLVQFMFMGIGTLSLIQMIIAGYQIAMSGVLPGGSSEAGKNRLIWSIIGLVVSLLSFAIINFFISTVSG